MKTIIFIVLTVAMMTSCGSDNETREAMTMASCVTPTETELYTALQTGDEIIKNDENTSIIIYKNVEGKSVCLLSGEAYIDRVVE